MVNRRLTTRRRDGDSTMVRGQNPTLGSRRVDRPPVEDGHHLAAAAPLERTAAVGGEGSRRAMAIARQTTGQVGKTRLGCSTKASNGWSGGV